MSERDDAELATPAPEGETMCACGHGKEHHDRVAAHLTPRWCYICACRRYRPTPTPARLREALEELVAAMDRYEADACEEPPQRHRDMMTRARRALGGGA
jgi:hypothetical protein